MDANHRQMERPMFKTFALAAAVAAGILFSLTACNTFKGLGKDISDTAEGAQKVIEGD